ncbi:Spiroplasmavirus-related protein [Spiroplasma kunkelii CR2-3x]|uniref:Spiroplasmavirus-related protein n=1 Tax=Spiroplasma kunkelii CR2-3x TaxID=273035 RepID=A0A0K2JFG6_SPIKU|nr:Spiroplasmavirus-related protein [Spiroplasma kunkelii CR2-3x]
MDTIFKTTKEYKKIKRDFIKDIFLLSLILFFGILLVSVCLSLFIYFSILCWNDKNFPCFVLAIIISVFLFIFIIFLIIMYIKYIFEIKVDFDVEKEKLIQYWQIEGVDKIE